MTQRIPHFTSDDTSPCLTLVRFIVSQAINHHLSPTPRWGRWPAYSHLNCTCISHQEAKDILPLTDNRLVEQRHHPKAWPYTLLSVFLPCICFYSCSHCLPFPKSLNTDQKEKEKKQLNEVLFEAGRSCAAISPEVSLPPPLTCLSIIVLFQCLQ